MMTKRIVVCVLKRRSDSVPGWNQKSPLVTKKRRTHATNHNVNRNPNGNQKTGLEVYQSPRSLGGWKYLTAIVFMPVKSVTVADPPRINIELTMMLVAKLETIRDDKLQGH